jgi:hypothetical protein
MAENATIFSVFGVSKTFLGSKTDQENVRSLVLL